VGNYIQDLLIAGVGALITALFNFYGTSSKNSVDREGIYAKYSQTLVDRINQQNEMISQQTTTINHLQLQVETLQAQNDRLHEQIKSLIQKVNKLSRAEEQTEEEIKDE
jgi:peptidoglycan hydrolase CwlO-like protein